MEPSNIGNPVTLTLREQEVLTLDIMLNYCMRHMSPKVLEDNNSSWESFQTLLDYACLVIHKHNLCPDKDCISNDKIMKELADTLKKRGYE